MKKYLLIVIVFFAFFSNLNSQYWAEQIGHQKPIINLISQGKSWNEILISALQDFKIEPKYLTDIEETIEFLDTTKISSSIDSLFTDICLYGNKRFPYRSSGHLTERLYTLPKHDTSDIKLPPEFYFDNVIYGNIAQLSAYEKSKHIAILISYLSNDSATRQVIKGFDWDDVPFYLSISDIAMELIEILTYCDFFDNTSQRYLLFSNLDDSSKTKIIKDVSDWYEATKFQTTSESIEYFLDHFAEVGYSYTNTCDNLLFIVDTILAKEKYQYFYEILDLPCRSAIEVGKILLTLGDRRVIEDCSNKIFNYRCMIDNGRECVKILLTSEYSYYKDNLLSELVTTEPYSNYRKNGSGPGYVWHTVFSEIAFYDKNDIPKTLIALMKIKEIVKDSNISGKWTWERKYPNQIEHKYRVCDFALLKFNELIKPIKIGEWTDIKERDEIIDQLISAYED